MKSKKYIIIITILISISLFSTACTNKIEEEVTVGAESEDTIQQEENTEENEALNEPTEKDNGKEWPADKMGSLPEPEGMIFSTENFIDSTEVLVKFSDSKDPEKYLEKLENLGYTFELVFEREESFVYEGFNKDNSKVKFGYNKDLNIPAQIVFTKNSSEPEAFFEKNN